MNDKISELLINIKNAGAAKLPTATVPHSKFKKEILELLKKEGYVADFSEEGEGAKKQLTVEVAYNSNGTPRINGLKRVSKLSRRTYLGYRNIKPVKFGHGIMVMSTPQGLMTEQEARKQKIGGEALFNIW